ncbi:unnamed protein product [Microthlaspi erraticum]|uniref:Uncharacterized protein n=1 Tax=Microthlaspi erraticum TaxID=1685480 RepID=A0A6D2L5R2_9BRAS|nr:unnamed protein product [Microthlaspi erraticum]
MLLLLLLLQSKDNFPGKAIQNPKEQCKRSSLKKDLLKKSSRKVAIHTLHQLSSHKLDWQLDRVQTLPARSSQMLYVPTPPDDDTYPLIAGSGLPLSYP